MNEIKLISKPVIQHDLPAVGIAIRKRIADLNLQNQVATEETLKYLKSIRAELNKEFADYELQRKAIKEGVNDPYTVFEARYKTEVTEQYKSADALLKSGIDSVELELKETKRKNIVSYFDEYCQSVGIDILKFEQANITINLSTTEKSYKEQCATFIDKVKDDLLLIATTEYPAEILVLFKQTLNASKAITEVRERKQKEKEEADRIKFTETARRKSLLVNMGFVYSDLTKTMNWVKQPESVYIRYTELETLNKEQWEETLQMLKDSIVEPETVKHYSEPLQAPTVVTPPPATYETKSTTEEIFEAAFEVKGTMAQLKSLSEFLKSNNITYKNL